jgi:hypothetical protein
MMCCCWPQVVYQLVGVVEVVELLEWVCRFFWSSGGQLRA